MGTPGNSHKYNFSATAVFFDIPAGTSSQPCVGSDTKGQPQTINIYLMASAKDSFIRALASFWMW